MTGDDWYQQIKARSVKSSHLAAMLITGMCLAADWGQHLHFAILIVFNIVMYPMNMLFDRIVAERAGQRAEVYRTIMNAALCIPVFQIVGWTLPVWFWIPFSVIALDGPSLRNGIAVLAIQGVMYTSAALMFGVSLIYPIAFTILAGACWIIHVTRSRIIHDIVRRSLQQHAELAAAHEGLKAEIAARERAEVELRQAQKLEAIGRLAAGVAHEINTPMQFVSDSLEFVSDGTGELIALAHACATPEQAERADLAYLSSNMPGALASAYDGVKRVASIIRSMKEFAHPGMTELGPVDLNVAIQNTLTISTYEYKLIADVVTELDELPTVRANGGELNQVLLNLIVNAAHAIADHAQAGERGRITIRSRRDVNAVVITVQDTGGGIPVAIRSKIFDPFFTTKAVGRGTGQGLAIARSVIERHGGALTFDSVLGIGTTFKIRIPVAMQSQMIPTAA